LSDFFSEIVKYFFKDAQISEIEAAIKGKRPGIMMTKTHIGGSRKSEKGGVVRLTLPLSFG